MHKFQAFQNVLPERNAKLDFDRAEFQKEIGDPSSSYYLVAVFNFSFKLKLIPTHALLSLTAKYV